MGFSWALWAPAWSADMSGNPSLCAHTEPSWPTIAALANCPPAGSSHSRWSSTYDCQLMVCPLASLTYWQLMLNQECAPNRGRLKFYSMELKLASFSSTRACSSPWQERHPLSP